MATVAWIGGMFTNFFIYIPAIGKTLDAPLAGKLMAAAMKRFRIMVDISMAVLSNYRNPDGIPATEFRRGIFIQGT